MEGGKRTHFLKQKHPDIPTPFYRDSVPQSLGKLVALSNWCTKLLLAKVLRTKAL